MIEFLISLIVFCLIASVILWAVRAILGAIPIGPPFAGIIYAAIVLILLLLFLSEIGWISAPHAWRIHR